MKKIMKLVPFLFYTRPESNYKIPQDFIIFENMPSIYHYKPSQVPLPQHAKPSQAKQLQGEVAGSCTRHGVTFSRSNTAMHKFPTLPIGFYDSEPPPNMKLNHDKTEVMLIQIKASSLSILSVLMCW